MQWCNFFKSNVNPAPHKKKTLEAFCQILHWVTCHVNRCSLELFHFRKWKNCIENMETKDFQSFINLHKTLNFSLLLPYAICSKNGLPEWWIAFIMSFVLTWKKLFCHKSIYMGEKSVNSNSVLISYSGMYNKDSNCILNYLPARTKSCLFCLINSKEKNKDKYKGIIGLVAGFLIHSFQTNWSEYTCLTLVLNCLSLLVFLSLWNIPKGKSRPVLRFAEVIVNLSSQLRRKPHVTTAKFHVNLIVSKNVDGYCITFLKRMVISSSIKCTELFI